MKSTLYMSKWIEAKNALNPHQAIHGKSK